MKTQQIVSIILSATLLLGTITGCAGDAAQGGTENTPPTPNVQATPESSNQDTTTPPPEDNARAAVVEDLAGSVTATASGEEMAAFRGLALLLDDAIGTGARSWSSLEFNEGWFALVEENTDVQISELAEAASRTEVAVSEGKIWVVIMAALGDDESFQVKTPNTTMSVRGTVFSVEYRDSTTRIAVFEGMVSVTAGDESFDLTAGEAAEIFSSDSNVVEVSRLELSQEDIAPLTADVIVEPNDMYEKLQSLTATVTLPPMLSSSLYDWKSIYLEIMLEALDYSNNSDSSSHLWESADYPLYISEFQLSDLNFDGIPELIIFGDGVSMANFMRIYTLTSDGAEKFFSDWGEAGGEIDYGFGEVGRGSFTLYRKHSDKSLAYYIDSYNGDTTTIVNGAYYRTDSRIVLNSTFADTAKLVEYSYEYHYDYDIELDLDIESYIYTIDGRIVNEDEYARLIENLFSDYEELPYSPAVLNVLWGGPFTDIVLLNFLDSYVPEQ